jgi:tetratricopeptide (TPR) repeat protein
MRVSALNARGVAVARGFAVGVGMRLDLSHYLPKFAINVPIRSPHRWPRRTTLAWLAGVGLAGLAAIVALLPLLMSARYRAAGEAALASDAATAAVAFQQALRWSPNNPEIYRALAQSYLRLNRPQEAIDMLEQAYRLRPESLLIRQELAQAYEAGGQIERANGLWASLGLRAPSMLGMGEQARQAKRCLEALAWYTRAERAGAELISSIAYFRALALRDCDQRDLAFDSLRRATNSDVGWITAQNRFQAWGLWGIWLYDRRQLTEAEGALHKAIVIYPADKSLQPILSESYRFFGLSQWRLAKQQEGLRSLEQAVTLDDRNIWAHIDYGKLLYLYDRRQASAVEAQFMAALRVKPDDLEIWKHLLDFWRRVGAIQEAETLCEQARRQAVDTSVIGDCPVPQ